MVRNSEFAGISIKKRGDRKRGGGLEGGEGRKRLQTIYFVLKYDLETFHSTIHLYQALRG